MNFKLQYLYLRIQQAWKAVAATVTTALITFLTSASEGLSAGESFRSFALSLLTGLVVFLTKNQPPPVRRRNRQRPLRANRTT